MEFETVERLEQVYATPAVVSRQTTRYARLVAEFQRRFGSRPDFIARSPGRVNLIGEHIDYSNYSVLPMALSEHDILIAGRVTAADDGSGVVAVVRVGNVAADKFPDRAVRVASRAPYIDIDAHVHEWSNYFLSGMKGVMGKLQPASALSMDCLVDGSVPSGAGVSSSSAFVCCAALATLRAYNGQMSRKELTETAIECERFVGVESGGMDQSCSIFGIAGTALLIDFYPSLAVHPTPLPRPLSDDGRHCFVIAHTLITSDKHVSAPVCYNLRVVETRLAALVLARLLMAKNRGPGEASWSTMVQLRGVQEWCVASGLVPNSSDDAADTNDDDRMCKALDFMVAQVETLLGQHKTTGYTREQVADILGITVEEMQANYMAKYPIRADTFRLYHRAKHVFTEARRVYEFKKICGEAGSADSFARLGRLMSDSQTSCRDLFDCSCAELDELATIASKNGALGSRLTGAGWGGCTVSLVPTSKLEEFMDALKRDYYASRADLLAARSMSDVLFASEPGRGAVLVSPSQF